MEASRSAKNSLESLNLTLDQTAKALAVSGATVRNWVKGGLITPKLLRPMTFCSAEVSRVAGKLHSGEIQRLKRRANKRGADRVRPELEWKTYPVWLQIAVSGITNLAEGARWTEAKTLLVVATAQAAHLGIAVLDRNPNPKQEVASHLPALTALLSSFREEEEISVIAVEVDQILNSLDPRALADTTLLGMILQSVRLGGDRAADGLFFTPPALAKEISDNLAFTGAKVIDPCCGAGAFLLALAKTEKLSPENIFGFECDPRAAFCARFCLLLAFPEERFVPNIFTTDALLAADPEDIFSPYAHLRHSFDIVVTNPPWGNARSQKYQNRFKDISSSELFSYFLVKATHLAVPDGTISFLLPEAALNVAQHRDVRGYLLSKTRLRSICMLGRAFSTVYTSVVRLDFQNHVSVKQNTIAVSTLNGSCIVEQEALLKNEDYRFNVLAPSRERDLLEIFLAKEASFLRNSATWALGIVTGNNAAHLSETCLPNREPIYRGQDIEPFRLKPPRAFIAFEPAKFQQVAPLRMYRAAEKLVYKFISKKLVVAYDDTGALTLNSANICISEISNWSAKAVCTYLNSHIAQFIFSTHFSTHKVLRRDLEAIPFFSCLNGFQAELESIFTTARLGRQFSGDLSDLLNARLGLTSGQRDLVAASAR